MPAQDVLKSYIDRAEWLELKGSFCNTFEALEYLNKNEVELIFLDIQMPKVSGIEFLRVLKNPPSIIITTAYSNYAIEAFEMDVRDYLMKPFSFDRFLKAVSRISPNPDPAHVHQFQHVTLEKGFAFFNVNKTMVKVLFRDVWYVESMREYIYIHNQSGKVVTKMTMGDVEKILGNGFLRIHRSFIVNLDKITAYNAEEVLIEKISLPIGVNYKKIVESILGQFVKHG